MTDDKQAIRDTIATWLTASRNGDTSTVLNLMTDDIVFLVPGTPPFGKAEFAAASAAMKNVRFEAVSDIKEIEVAGDWGWCRSHLTVTISPPNGKTMRRSGYTLSIFRKTPDGRWQLARDANLLTTET